MTLLGSQVGRRKGGADGAGSRATVAIVDSQGDGADQQGKENPLVAAVGALAGGEVSRLGAPRQRGGGLGRSITHSLANHRVFVGGLPGSGAAGPRDAKGLEDLRLGNGLASRRVDVRGNFIHLTGENDLDTGGGFFAGEGLYAADYDVVHLQRSSDHQGSGDVS